MVGTLSLCPPYDPLEFELALSPNIRGSLLMAVAMAAFTINDSITKAVSSEINFGEVMLVRGLFAILLVAALAFHQRAIRSLRTIVMKPVALRVVGEIGGTITFMAAITHLPLANTSAIFQALPLAITLGAAVVFREPVGWRRWLAITAGFIGVLIIVRPGIEGFNQYSLLALVSVAFCALRGIGRLQAGLLGAPCDQRRVVEFGCPLHLLEQLFFRSRGGIAALNKVGLFRRFHLTGQSIAFDFGTQFGMWTVRSA